MPLFKRLLPALLISPCIHAAEFSIQPAVATLHYQAEEHNQIGTVINQESGHLPQFEISMQAKEAPWLIKIDYSRAEGDVNYQGYTQMGIPLTTRTELNIESWQALLGYQWQVADQQQITLGAGLNGLQIDRHILPALGSLPLNETLNSQRFVLSLSWQWQMDALPVALNTQLDILPQHQNRLTVDTQGLYDTIELDTDQHTDWRWALDAEWRCTPNARLGIGLAYQSYQPGSSQQGILKRNGLAAATVRYPGSDQRLLVLKSFFSWHF
ncbi:hypothetical protein WAE56_10965 [Iodobacter sp. LRB]|uniref:hypothetical protein n=1 Tax=unclassified Iodobacter TaxID=235634 RepID=UPI000C11E8F9|nr:hypothetical protein [Iodobacter sp. BJB302]PHV01229.1 hypothetical protein CSQ88_13250 [Iodobacter sp. BJB302]